MDKGEYLRYVKKAGWKMTTSELSQDRVYTHESFVQDYGVVFPIASK